MNSKLKQIVLTGAIAVTVALGLNAVAKNEMSGRVAPTPAPQWTLKDTGGREISLQSVSKGKKATLLNFWFAACPPCQEEFPTLEKIYHENSPKGLEVVAINATDDAQTMQKFIEQHGLSMKFARDADRSVSAQYGVVATPTNILLDANNNIIWRSVGLDETGLREAIAAVVG